ISNKDYAANFADFLDAQSGDQPFCFWYGGHEPHRSYSPGEGQRGGKDPATIQVPPYLPDDPIVRADLCDYAYEIEWFDRHLGLMLQELEKRGLLSNTLVVVTSDNGMPFPRVKGQMYECDFKLPLAVMWPAKIPGGRISNDLVSFTDFAPTFLEAAGIKENPKMAGKSLLPILTASGSGILEPSRDAVVMGREKHDLGSEDDLGYPVRCLRDHQYLYVRNFEPDRWPAGNPETGFTNCDSSPTKDFILAQRESGQEYFFQLAFGKRPAEELYDIIEDEPCIHNLALDPAFDAVLRKMRDRLELILKETGDPRIFGNGEIFEAYPYVGSKTHSWKAYKDGTWKKQKY
ncbi:MAG: sulfatase-like hydrolase/transferase, partial [Spirochaetia bacterium]|nr:sulfatase-like hydrolase/transferase [Spirochaetia bacterium]